MGRLSTCTLLLCKSFLLNIIIMKYYMSLMVFIDEKRKKQYYYIDFFWFHSLLGVYGSNAGSPNKLYSS